MSRIQKIRNFLSGMILILFSVLLIIGPKGGLGLVAFVISIGLIARGIGYFTYYFSMARHMVGGKAILFYAVILFDVGMFTLSLSDIPRIYLAMYLLFINGLNAILEIVRGIDAMKKKSPSWRLTTVFGVINFALAVVCIAFIRSETALVYVFCAGMLYSGIMKIISSFRRTAIVYVQ